MVDLMFENNRVKPTAGIMSYSDYLMISTAMKEIGLNNDAAKSDCST